MTTPFEGRSEQRRSLASVHSAGVEPAALHTRYLRAVDGQQPWGTLPPEHQIAFCDWAAERRSDVATVTDLAAIADAEEAVFPPSPAFRVNWGRVAAWSPVLLLAGYTVVRFVNEHRELAFWTVAFAAVFGVSHLVDRVRA
jgi:hypothetical protein